MKLSIIVPIYNVEKTLKRCVDSILRQGLCDYELLLIDDGSPDNSGQIADEYALRNDRIKEFHKKNGGLSDARNYGISKSQGEYIGFVDSDDELEPGTLEHLINIISIHPEYDIVEYSILENPGKPNERLFATQKYTYNNAMEWLEDRGLEHCWVCNKIFKRKIFDNTLFLVNKIYEDIYFTGDILKQNPIIASTDKGRYIYHYNENGITANDRKKGLGMLLEAKLYAVKKIGIDTREKRWNRIYLELLTAQLYHYKKTGQISLWKQHIAIKKCNSMIDCLKAITLNTFGLRITCLIFKWFHRK